MVWEHVNIVVDIGIEVGVGDGVSSFGCCVNLVFVLPSE